MVFFLNDAMAMKFGCCALAKCGYWLPSYISVERSKWLPLNLEGIKKP